MSDHVFVYWLRGVRHERPITVYTCPPHVEFAPAEKQHWCRSVDTTKTSPAVQGYPVPPPETEPHRTPIRGDNSSTEPRNTASQVQQRP